MDSHSVHVNFISEQTEQNWFMISTSQQIYTQFMLLIVLIWLINGKLIYPYSLGLFYWHWGILKNFP